MKHAKNYTSRDYFEFILSAVYDRSDLDPQHARDLDGSGITVETRTRHKIRSVPPDMIDPLLGYHAPNVRSAYVIPFPDPRGTWLDHIRLKVFMSDASEREVTGDHVQTIGAGRYRYNSGRTKYLVRRHSPPRLFFTLATLPTVLHGDEVLWIAEGCKKGLALAQVGLPTVAIESPFSWHLKNSRELLPDFASIALKGRTIELVPDSDVETNPLILRSMRQLADALRAVGACPRLVRLPASIKGVDDFIEMKVSA